MPAWIVATAPMIAVALKVTVAVILLVGSVRKVGSSIARSGSGPNSSGEGVSATGQSIGAVGSGDGPPPAVGLALGVGVRVLVAVGVAVLVGVAVSVPIGKIVPVGVADGVMVPTTPTGHTSTRTAFPSSDSQLVVALQFNNATPAP